MRVSARCDYACRALLELALHWPSEEPLQIHQISERQDIPQRYLVQILLQLKRIGVVVSLRGKQGGYSLAKDPEEISFGQVIRDIIGPLLPMADSALKKESVFAEIWRETENAMAKVLDRVSFKDICEKAKDASKVTFYDI